MDPNVNKQSQRLTRRTGRFRSVGLVLGLVSFLAILALPAPGDLPEPAWRVVAIACLMIVWWIAETLPLAVTALLPLILIPLLGISDIDAAAAPYADPIIFLFMGGLMLGQAIQKWDLHHRIALAIVLRVGVRPSFVILGFMVAAAFISMWVSNTAAAAMMLPVSLSVVALLIGPTEHLSTVRREDQEFAVALLIGVAFATSIGGVATLIGTPPNALFAAFMRRTYGLEIGFAQWMLVGVPVAVLMLAATWIIVTRVAFRVGTVELDGVRERLQTQITDLGPMSRDELRVGIVFGLTALAWIGRPLMSKVIPGLSDTVIAVLAAVALFLVPSTKGTRLMDWKTAQHLPWAVLLLFGGGLSLASAIEGSGLALWIGTEIGLLGAIPLIALIAILIIVTIVLSELASNTATAATLLPIAASIAAGLGLDPLTLTVPVVLAASAGYMLPVATPPNALFFSSGYLTVPQMVRAGALVDLIGAVIVLAAAQSIARLVFVTAGP